MHTLKLPTLCWNTRPTYMEGAEIACSCLGFSSFFFSFLQFQEGVKAQGYFLVPWVLSLQSLFLKIWEDFFFVPSEDKEKNDYQTGMLLHLGYRWFNCRKMFSFKTMWDGSTD
jgi:hypothetical protein